MPSLADAIFQKFKEINSEIDTPAGEFVIVAPKIDAKHGIPQTLVISSRNVNKAGNPNELKTLLSNVVELDVSYNALEDIPEIGTIFQHGLKLQFLNFGFNNLSEAKIPPCPTEFPTTESLRTLILIKTGVRWDVVWFLLRHASNVKELHLSLNDYTQVDLSGLETCSQNNDHSFLKVEKLMFDSNRISSWDEISKLGIALSELTHLSLTDSPIDSIPRNGGDNFPNLKILWLSNCRISKLDDFENLKYFAALTDLRVNGIPFLEDFTEEARRQHFISLLPNITTLNRGRAISEDDRITAERNFIRYYQNHSEPPARYHQLKSIHGEVPRLVDINFKPPTKANILIRFEDKELCRIDINLKKTVKELKDFLEPIVGIAASNMDLFYLDPVDINVGKEVMRYPNKQLYTYHMKNSDEIFVYKKGTVVCGSTKIYN